MLSKENLLSKVEPIDIYLHYIPNLTTDHIRRKKNVLSVFKAEKRPSMSVWKDRTTGKIGHKCYTTGHAGDCFSLVADLHQLDCRSQFTEVLARINRDMNLGLEETDKTEYSTPNWKSTYYPTITPAGLEFFNHKCKANEALLSRYRIKQVKTNWRIHSRLRNYEKEGLLAFEFNINGRRKIYVPKQEGLDQKFVRKNQTKYDIFGFDQLKGKRVPLLLLLEGETDTLCAAAHGIYAVGLQSASARLSKSQIRELKKIGINLLTVFDRGDAGDKARQWYAKEHDIPYFILPAGGEDICEYVPFLSSEDLEEFKRELFNTVTEHRRSNGVYLFEKNWQYHKHHKDYGIVSITNFIIEVDTMVVSELSSKRLIRLRTQHYSTPSMEVETSVFNSEQKFEDWASNIRGNFHFTGTKKDLQMLKKICFRYNDFVEEIEALGYQHQSNSFILSNAVISLDGKIERPDKRGIVGDYYVPAAAESNQYNSYYRAEQKLRYADNASKQVRHFSDFMGDIVQSFDERIGIITTTFLLAGLFFDLVSKQSDGQFPILNLAGQKGSGKGSLVKMLLSPFTAEAEEISLQNATKAGFVRKFAQVANLPIWLDEFNNNISPDIIQALKNVYDGIGRVRAFKSQDNRTYRTPILAPCILSGQEAPNDEALFSRCIAIHLPLLIHSQEAIGAHLKRINVLQKGTSHILLQLLPYRDAVEKNYSTTFYTLLDYFSEQVTTQNMTANTRLLKNYASIITPAVIAIEHGLAFYEKVESAIQIDHLKQVFLKNLLVQAQEETQKDEVVQMLHLFCMAMDKKLLLADQDYQVDELAGEFILKSDIVAQYNALSKKILDTPGPNAKAIEKYIKSKSYFKQYRRAYFNHLESKKQYRCLIFYLEKLPEQIRYFLTPQKDTS